MIPYFGHQSVAMEMIIISLKKMKYYDFTAGSRRDKMIGCKGSSLQAAKALVTNKKNIYEKRPM